MCDLIDAATDGDLAKVTELLKNVKVSIIIESLVNIKDCWSEGWRVLYFTQDVDYIDECGYTALHCAAENGHLDIVRELIKAGANINKVSANIML